MRERNFANPLATPGFTGLTGSEVEKVGLLLHNHLADPLQGVSGFNPTSGMNCL